MKTLQKMIVLGSLIGICLGASCEKKATTEGDKLPPAAPVLIPASGAVTDPHRLDTERDAGIDAVPDQNWIELQWEPPTENEDGSPLIDLAGYYIYRGVWIDTLGAVVLDSLPLATVEEPLRDSYIDASPLELGTTYFYTITAYDLARNESAFSDTVNFRLVAKAIPNTPADDQTISIHDEPLEFSWRSGGSEVEDLFFFYVKVFHHEAPEKTLVWKSKAFSTFDFLHTRYGETGIVRTGYETLPPGNYTWRVDIYGETPEWGPWGSESREVRFIITE